MAFVAARVAVSGVTLVSAARIGRDATVVQARNSKTDPARSEGHRQTRGSCITPACRDGPYSRRAEKQSPKRSGHTEGARQESSRAQDGIREFCGNSLVL